MPCRATHISQLCLRLKITALFGERGRASARSFMPNQAARVEATMNGTQMKPAFCSHSSPPLATTCGAPPTAPKTPAVMTSGTTNCITETPRLPRPALSASALPFSALGKK